MCIWIYYARCGSTLSHKILDFNIFNTDFTAFLYRFSPFKSHNNVLILCSLDFHIQRPHSFTYNLLNNHVFNLDFGKCATNEIIPTSYLNASLRYLRKSLCELFNVCWGVWATLSLVDINLQNTQCLLYQIWEGEREIFALNHRSRWRSEGVGRNTQCTPSISQPFREIRK